MKGLILYFLQLLLIVLSNFIPNNIYKQPRVFKTFLEKNFELILRQEIFGDLIL